MIFTSELVPHARTPFDPLRAYSVIQLLLQECIYCESSNNTIICYLLQTFLCVTTTTLWCQHSPFQAVIGTVSSITYCSLKWPRIVFNSTSKWKHVQYVQSFHQIVCMKWTKMWLSIPYNSLNRSNKQWSLIFIDSPSALLIWKTPLPVALVTLRC